MKRKLIKIAAFLLAAVLCIPLTAPRAAAATRVNGQGETLIRVGLASTSSATGSSALEAAPLVNRTGSGYRIGYYDDDLNFVELLRTEGDMKEIAVLKTQNLFYGYDRSQGRNTYSASFSGSVAVGCYHIVLGDLYPSLAQAQAAAAAYEGGFPAWIGGTFQARVGAYTSQNAAIQARTKLGLEGCSIVGTTTAGISVVKMGTDQVLFQSDDSSRALAVLPDVTRAADPSTWFSGNAYRGGFTFRRINGGNLTVVNVVELEDYVKGVVCYEMGRDWPLEALKAQAMCARTYVLSKLNAYRSLGFDVSNTAYSQVYNGMGSGREGYGPSEKSDQACDATRGLVVKYGGKLAETPYSSSHGGASEDAFNIWGTDTANAAPYLKGIVDPYEKEADDINDMSPWTVTFSAASLTRQVQKYGFAVGTSVSRITLTYSPTGNVIRMVLGYANGKSNTFTPRSSPSIRGVLGLRSIHFTVNGQKVAPAVSPATPNPSNPPAPVDQPSRPGTAQPGTSVPGNPGTSNPAPGTTPLPGPSEGSLTVNGGQSLPLEEAWVVDGTGTPVPAGESPQMITGQGDTTSALGTPSGSSGAAAPEQDPDSAAPYRSGAAAFTGSTTAAEALYGNGQDSAYPGSAPAREQGDPGAQTIATGGRQVTIVGDTFSFSGAGWGHQVGMSQYGAYAMADRGFTYDQIVTFYFPGTELVPW